MPWRHHYLGRSTVRRLAARLAEDPELRGQFQRLQQADEAIKVAFAKCVGSCGLANRISRRLAEVIQTATPGSVPSATDGLETPPLVDAAETTSIARPRFENQRSVFDDAACSFGFTGAFGRSRPVGRRLDPFSPAPARHAELRARNPTDFFDRDSQLSGDDVSRVAPPAEYPISRDIVPLQGIRWRHVEKFPGGPAVAYDLPTNGGRATLYVVEEIVPGLPSMPPDRPISNTGGKSAAAWQAGDTVYVLVVEGDAGMYSRSSRPVTWAVNLARRSLLPRGTNVFTWLENFELAKWPSH